MSFPEGKNESSTAAISPTRYERLELIGSGSFGEVYRGWDREDGREVAIKVIDLEIVEDDITEIHKEVAMLAECRSSNITEYYASVMLPGTTELLIVMELMASSVSDLLDGEGLPLDEQSIAYILREVLKALVYLHTGHRIHRDVKSANVLLSAHGEVKISDFGVSGQLSKTVAFKRKTFVGSPFWMAPEVISANTKDDGYTETADIWSLGITAYEMATGKPPHADLHPMRALFLIPGQDAPRLEGPFSQEYKSFIAQCLQKDPNLRPSAKTLLHHPFLAGPHDSGKLAELVHIHVDKKRNMRGFGGRTNSTAHSRQPASKWDFDTMGPGTVAKNPKGSLRSHQINSFTIRDSTWGSTFAQRHLPSWGEGSEPGSQSPTIEETGTPSDAGALDTFNTSQARDTKAPADSTDEVSQISEAPSGEPSPGGDQESAQAPLQTIPEEKTLRPGGGLGPELVRQRSGSPGGGWLAGIWRGRREDSSKLKLDSPSGLPLEAPTTTSQAPFEAGQTVRYIPEDLPPVRKPGHDSLDPRQAAGTVKYTPPPESIDIQGTTKRHEDLQAEARPAFLHAAKSGTLSAMLPAENARQSSHLDLRELLFGAGTIAPDPKLKLPKPTLQIVALLQDSEGNTSLSPMQPTPSPGFETPLIGSGKELGALGNFLMARWKTSTSWQHEQGPASSS